MSVRTDHLRRAQELVREAEEDLTVIHVDEDWFPVIAKAQLAVAYMALGDYPDIEPEASE